MEIKFLVPYTWSDFAISLILLLSEKDQASDQQP